MEGRLSGGIFDWTRFAPAAPDLPALEGAQVRSENLVYDLFISSPEDRFFDDSRCSKLMGKYLILPLPREKTTQWPMREASRLHDSFVVGTDGEGIAIRHTCDPDALANYFGANAGAPNYLTPIAFSRDVMTRYYDSPSKFVVTAGSVSRHGAWLLPVDVDHQDRVVAYLGDLGRIPYAEQGHWRTHQLTDERAKVSDSAFRRDFKAQFAEVSQVEARFRARLVSVRDAWRGAFGWSLFREHSDDDAHVLSSFRVPLTNDSLTAYEEQRFNLIDRLCSGVVHGFIDESVHRVDYLKMVLKVAAQVRGDTDYPHIHEVAAAWRQGQPARRRWWRRRAFV